MNNMYFYLSSLHNKFIVMESDNEYILKIIGKNNDAICLIEDKLIIINKNISKNWENKHYLAVEAHEISHYLAGHNERNNIQSEKEADKMAYIILNYKSFKNASKLIEDRFYKNYKIHIKDFKISNKLKLKILFFIFKLYLKKLFCLDTNKKIYNSKKFKNYVRKR
jgi:hypothetical protein